MNNNKILEEVKVVLEGITGIPTNIVLPNTSFTPTLGTPWIRLSMTQGEPVQLTIGRNRTLRYTGTVQIDIFGLKNTGLSTLPNDIINEFLKFENRFLPYDLTHKIQIQNAFKGNNIQENNWSRDIVFLRYFLEAPTPV